MSSGTPTGLVQKAIQADSWSDSLVWLYDAAPKILKLEKQRDDLLTTVENALVSLAIINMPRQDDNVATDTEILKIMADSFEAAIASAKA